MMKDISLCVFKRKSIVFFPLLISNIPFYIPNKNDWKWWITFAVFHGNPLTFLQYIRLLNRITVLVGILLKPGLIFNIQIQRKVYFWKNIFSEMQEILMLKRRPRRPREKMFIVWSLFVYNETFFFYGWGCWP